jgi:hypothetical protein
LTLRHLAEEVNTTLTPPNSTHHTSPNLQADIDTVLKSLVEESIHRRDLSRRFSDKAMQAKDALALGLQNLEGIYLLFSLLGLTHNSIKDLACQLTNLIRIGLEHASRQFKSIGQPMMLNSKVGNI